ncbi:hypothetical protein ASF48_14955 [Rathayibacter sp. Leaf299]|uniref:hypothetical protein n=1 Tax=Rathayibacter sp. Leaf299 TaxID=1736328 RepID=UPI000700BD11|nr:hypothetical protein [Rathayibacter sp. Leaf299]KQQ19242.1 hypothetical protein ASF48_14955 [Rathayibacter sp. Leaf299]
MSVSLAPFPSSDLAAWMKVQRASYVADRLRAGDDAAAAERNADASHDRLFAEGRLAPGHDVLRILDDGVPVGVV